jgi:hypothetical protein
LIPKALYRAGDTIGTGIRRIDRDEWRYEEAVSWEEMESSLATFVSTRMSGLRKVRLMYPNCQLYVSCVIYTAQATMPLLFQPAFLSDLAELKAHLGIDAYILPGDSESREWCT